MIDAHQLSQDIFEAWRDAIMKTISSGVVDPKLFPLVPVYVQTEDGIKAIDHAELYPEMNGVLLKLKKE